MSPAEKLAGLTNAETVYGSLVDYLDGYYHDSLYYLKADAEAKFFGPDNQGSGSGCVAELLDGMTADAIIASGFPSGGICAWANSEETIPTGFALANGLNSTPDLRNRIPVAAGGNYVLGATGGANTVTTTGTVTIAGHALTAAEIAKHTHGTITDYYGITSSTYGGYDYTPASGSTQDISMYTGNTGDGGSHSHAGTWKGASSKDKRPPFMALCWICRS